jgi:adenosylcobyric acid synthase
MAAGLAGLSVEKIFRAEAEGFHLNLSVLQSRLKKKDLVFIGQPNNPTGDLCDADSLRALATDNPSMFFVVDEAFADFVKDMDSLTRRRPSNVMVLCSLTKFYAIPGIRLGLAVGDSGVIMRMREMMPPWSVNTIAQVVGEAALKDEGYAKRTRDDVERMREVLAGELKAIPGLTVYPGRANFLLVKIDKKNIKAPQIAERLIGKGIAIRVCKNFDGLDARFFRVAVKTEEENGRLCDALREVLGVAAERAKKPHKPALMFQGTSSNAGKSILTAALCRILLQDGYRVAPFKAQNMSLNSFVTREGGEMGRAQVVQAQACRLEPDVRMNPVLLKPNTDTGSQVIVLGKPVGNMDVDAYIGFKPLVFETVKDAFDSLARENDAVILEGAGSPAEVNLKHHDIVNMQMARHAGSPVLLVGDIDRGGVFASFVGTMEVLQEWERALIAGFVINRFRGDERLLGEAIDFTERHTGRPTFGVVPYLHNLGLPEEDSVTFKNALTAGANPVEDRVEIALIDLPHISNFTDYDSLLMEPDVLLRVVRSSRDMGNPDAVILPGSKNVIGDLDYLRRDGLGRKIMDLAAQGHTELIGICGGFQILGGKVADPYGIESGGREVAGLGILPVTTTLAHEKTLACVRARHVESGCIVRGYEIHHGQTAGKDVDPAVLREDGEVLGARSADGRFWGTYLHGIFDADEFRRWFIDRLRVRKGFPPAGRILSVYDLEPAFDRLADAVRKSLRVDDIYRLMGLR